MTHLLYYLLRHFFYLIIAVILIIVLLSIFSSFNFFGRFKFLIISSDSMKPALGAGDLVFINVNPKQISKNDVIVFDDPRDSGFLITHRVKKIFQSDSEKFIQTKGDANNNYDDWRIYPEDIYGKVTMAFPLIGYALAFTKTFAGFTVLIVIPSVIVIANELAKIKIYLERKEVLK